MRPLHRNTCWNCNSGKWPPNLLPSAWRSSSCVMPLEQPLPTWAGMRSSSAPTLRSASWPSWPYCPILLLQAGMIKLTALTGINYSLDPIPLFFLALVFGLLYHRTHRIAPSLLLHMTFNATSILLIYAS